MLNENNRSVTHERRQPPNQAHETITRFHDPIADRDEMAVIGRSLPLYMAQELCELFMSKVTRP